MAGNLFEVFGYPGRCRATRVDSRRRLNGGLIALHTAIACNGSQYLFFGLNVWRIICGDRSFTSDNVDSEQADVRFCHSTGTRHRPFGARMLATVCRDLR